MDLISTIKGSLLEGFFPEGWDLKKLDECCNNLPESITEHQKWWHSDFKPVMCEDLSEFDTLMGHEIALRIRESKEQGRKIILILPVGPMGMYKWVLYFLKEWRVDCKHVYGFNMDEWSDEKGNTLPSDNPGAFQNAMESATIGPGIFLNADWIIGGCDGSLGRGMMWQGLSLWVTLRHGPSVWIPSSFMPALPGKFFFLKELAGPLEAECN